MLEPLKAEAKKRQEATQLAGKDRDGFPVRSVPTVPEEPKESGEAVAQAAALVGLGATSVYQAKAVIDRAPERLGPTRAPPGRGRPCRRADAARCAGRSRR